MKMPPLKRQASGLLTALTLIATGSVAATYKGDGVLIDHGSRLITNRYEVTLGAIDIGQPRVWHFHAAGLPAREFVLGIMLELEDCSLLDSSIEIALEVTDEHGSKVIKEDQALRNLAWDRVLGQECKSPFGYVRGQAHEMPAGTGDVRMQPVLTGADCGRGTYFNSRPNGVYEITVSVQPGERPSPGAHMAKIVLKDNGASAGGCRSK